MYRPPVVSAGLKWQRMRVWSTVCPRYVITLQSNGCARCFGSGYCPYLKYDGDYNELRGNEREKVRADIPVVVITDAIRIVGDCFVLFIRAHFT